MLPDWLTGVQIETAAVPSKLEGAMARGVLWQAAPGRFLLEAPEVARYLIEAGRHVTIDPFPSADHADVLRFLRMAPLAALLYQRGILAFHAAAVSGPKGAVLIAGDSGAGKSTLLAELLKRGWNLLADDLAAVTLNEYALPMVLPMYPELTLWSDAMVNLSFDDKGKGKHTLLMKDRFVTIPQPLQTAIRLTVSKDEIMISDIGGAKLFSLLTTFSYNSRVADALFDRTAYMRLSAGIAGNVHVSSLSRPRGKWCVEELADIVVEKCR